MIPDRRAPVVTHMVWYKVGAADETPGKSGLAHFLEHLLFKGTAKNPAGRFSQEVAAVGGQENAFTSQDYTGYFQRVVARASQDADGVRGRPHDRSGADRRAVLPELKVVLEEQNQRVANNPRARLAEQIDAALYLNHPYGRPVIGWRHEIEKLNREDALAFYKRFYTPNNAVLVVAGDVTTEEVRALAEETYGKVAEGRRDRAAAAAAGAAAGRGAPRHAGRSARRAAEPAPLLPRAVVRDRQARRSRGARGAGLHPRARQHQPALSRAGGRAAKSRSAPAAGTAARRSTPRSSASTARRSRA